MQYSTASIILSSLLILDGRISNGFVVQSPRVVFSPSSILNQNAFTATIPRRRHVTYLQESPKDDQDKDDEIERLRRMAAKLRSEAAQLEADKAQQLADAAEKAFRQFDTNQDGQICFDELKAGLEKALKTELPEKRVREVMKTFDESGDGVLQLEEFVTVDKFKNQLEALAREEKKMAVEAAKRAKLEKEASMLLEAQIELINDKPPTNTDKILSVIPYLFPLLDGFQYGRFLLQGETSNPIVIALAVLYTLYRNIPFSGFVAFFALSILSGNLQLNRLVRFNMQQAIYLDIALIIPGLVSGLYFLINEGIKTPLPAGFQELFTDTIFITLILTLTYCTVSSLLGKTPDKVPGISGIVKNRMPTVEMFDEQGRFIGPLLTEEKKKEEEEKKKKEEKKDDEEKK